MRKLLGKPAIDHTNDSSPITSSPHPTLPPAYRPNAAQNAIFHAGVPVACLDRSQDGRSVVLAGRHVLKIVHIDHQSSSIEERADLRAAITAQPPQPSAVAGRGGGVVGAGGMGAFGADGGMGGHHHGGGFSLASVSDQLSIKDVKWAQPSGGGAPSALFTACANGKIFHYDLAQAGPGGVAMPALQVITIREDSRQVNTLDVNPHRGSYLLSGSQDGFVRCFDVRTPVPARGGGLTFRAMQPPFKCNDGVRHVKWSPRDAFYFACGTDSGVVMKWDLRKAQAPILRINAHETNRACTAVAWHPDGEHLISAGTDSRCHVWDLGKGADKRQKPKYTLSTPAPVASLAWRPGQWSATAQGKRAAQVAMSYDDSSPAAGGGGRRQGGGVVHLWDLGRPTLPYKEIDRFESSPSALLWHDQDLLWTAGPDGIFSQCDFAFAHKVVDRTAVSTMAFSPRGDVVMFLDERAQPRPHRPLFPSSFVLKQQTQRRPASHHLGQPSHADMLPTSPSYTGTGSSPTAPAHALSASRSDSEDDVVGSFLGPRKPGRTRRLSVRSAHAFSTTPPSVPGVVDDQIVGLDQSLKLLGMYKPQQSMAVGPVPAAPKVGVYHFLSTQYLETLERELPSRSPVRRPMVERVVLILEHYARAAECVSQFRLAQTWRILAFAMDLLLKSRARYHHSWRKARVKLAREPNGSKLSASRTSGGGELTPRRLQPQVSGNSHADKLGGLARSLLAEEFESTSNVPTPLARPVSDSPAVMAGRFVNKQLTPVLEIEKLDLPPAVQSPQQQQQPPTSHPAANGAEQPRQRQRLDSAPISLASHDSDNTQFSSTEGYDFYDMEAMTHAIDVPQPRGGHHRPPPPLPADYVEPRSPTSSEAASGPPRRRQVLRHDSDESFASMFAISQTSAGDSSITESPERSAAGLRRALASSSVAAGAAGSLSRQQHLHRSSGSGSDGGEFRSRIRGKELHSQGSPASVVLGHAGGPSTFRPTGALTTQTSDDDFPDQILFTQTTDESQSPQAYRLDDRFGSSYQHSARPPTFKQQHMISFPSIYTPPWEDESPEMTEGDYLPWSDDPPYPFPATADPSDPSSNTDSSFTSTPLQPYVLISRALAYETRSSALNASAMILLLKPLVPASVIDAHQANAILRQHHSRLMGMQLFVEAALLRKLCVRGWPGGDLEAHWADVYPAVFSQAQQGVVAAFLCPGCRRPREIDRSSASTDSVWRRCGRCKCAVGPCAVCGHRELAQGAAAGDAEGEDAGNTVSTWWFCAGCSHGGHASCLAKWHSAHLAAPSPPRSSSQSAPASPTLYGNADEDEDEEEDLSGGCCPLDGCGHACLPGRWRAESNVARTEEVSRAVLREAAAAATRAGRMAGSGSPVTTVPPGGGGGSNQAAVDLAHQLQQLVRGDTFEVAQSRAVDSVRETLGSGGSTGLGAATPATAGAMTPLGSSPGRSSMAGLGFITGIGGSGERERRKSVKFAGAEARGG